MSPPGLKEKDGFIFPFFYTSYGWISSLTFGPSHKIKKGKKAAHAIH
jgi:hypothetical protein